MKTVKIPVVSDVIVRARQADPQPEPGKAIWWDIVDREGTVVDQVEAPDEDAALEAALEYALEVTEDAAGALDNYRKQQKVVQA